MQASAPDLMAAGGAADFRYIAAASGNNSTTISLLVSNISRAFTKQTIIAQTTTLLGDLQVLTQQLSAHQTQLQAGISALNNTA